MKKILITTMFAVLLLTVAATACYAYVRYPYSYDFSVFNNSTDQRVYVPVVVLKSNGSVDLNLLQNCPLPKVSQPIPPGDVVLTVVHVGPNQDMYCKR